MSDLLAPDKPDEIQVLLFDPTSLLIEALRSLGTNASAAELRAYLAKQTRVYGVAGPYNFATYPGHGLDESAVYMVRWDVARDEYIAVSRSGGNP
jgi:hypothetical protein